MFIWWAEGEGIEWGIGINGFVCALLLRCTKVESTLRRLYLLEGKLAFSLGNHVSLGTFNIVKVLVNDLVCLLVNIFIFV